MNAERETATSHPSRRDGRAKRHPRHEPLHRIDRSRCLMPKTGRRKVYQPSQSGRVACFARSGAVGLARSFPEDFSTFAHFNLRLLSPVAPPQGDFHPVPRKIGVGRCGGRTRRPSSPLFHRPHGNEIDERARQTGIGQATFTTGLRRDKRANETDAKVIHQGGRNGRRRHRGSATFAGCSGRCVRRAVSIRANRGRRPRRDRH